MSTIQLQHPSQIRHLTQVRPARHLHAVPTRPNDEFVPVRLTLRGKVVLLMVAAMVIGVLVIMFGSSTAATGSDGAEVATTSVTVTSGTTLWGLAADANPSGDIRRTIDDIIRINSLPNGTLQLGSEIAVPVYTD